MKYYVVAKDGSKFGPVDVDKLNDWAIEGRIVADTVIERASDGIRGAASQVPGVAMPPPALAASAASPQGSAPQPTQTVAGPSTSIGPAGVQFKEPDFVPQPRTASAIYGEPEGYSGGYERETYGSGYLPAEICGKFNWGAFFLTWIWGLCHGAYVTLWFLALDIAAALINYATRSPEGQSGSGQYAGGNPIAGIIGLVLLGLKIWFGAKGYEWAWESGRYKTPEDCRRAQAIWGWCGLAFAVVFTCLVFVIVTAILSAQPRINPWVR